MRKPKRNTVAGTDTTDGKEKTKLTSICLQSERLPRGRKRKRRRRRKKETQTAKAQTVLKIDLKDNAIIDDTNNDKEEEEVHDDDDDDVDNEASLQLPSRA